MQVFASGGQIFLFNDAIAIPIENEENVGIAESVHETALGHGFPADGGRLRGELRLVESIEGNPLSIGGLGVGIIGWGSVEFSCGEGFDKNFGDVAQGNERIGVGGRKAEIGIKPVFDFELLDGRGVLTELGSGFCRQHGFSHRYGNGKKNARQDSDYGDHGEQLDQGERPPAPAGAGIKARIEGCRRWIHFQNIQGQKCRPGARPDRGPHPARWT